jgi:hypothetical protein
MAADADRNDRTSLEELSAKLREATCAAMQNRSALARSLDESRGELERLLMLTTVDPMERRRIVVRAQMMLDAWQAMAAGSFARSRAAGTT